MQRQKQLIHTVHRTGHNAGRRWILLSALLLTTCVLQREVHGQGSHAPRIGRELNPAAQRQSTINLSGPGAQDLRPSTLANGAGVDQYGRLNSSARNWTNRASSPAAQFSGGSTYHFNSPVSRGAPLSLGSQWNRGNVNHSWRHSGSNFGLNPYMMSDDFWGTHYAAGPGMLPSPLYLNPFWIYGPALAVQPPVYVRNQDQAVLTVPTFFDQGFGWGGFDWGGMGFGGGYGPWCDPLYGCPGPMPTYGFASPVWPGMGIVPSVMNISYINSMDFGYQMMQSRASWNVVPGGTSIWGQQTQFPPASVFRDPGHVVELAPEPIFIEEQLPVLPDPGDAIEPPVINEFPAVPIAERLVGAADRVQSLRYQATGDTTFRQGDYASAEVYYRTAMQTAPSRQAPYLRLAMVMIARQQFDQAASFLKSGLMIEDDPTRGWIGGDELYGPAGARTLQTHANRLWRWVDQRPLSADRLLLAGTFQMMRGETSSADQFLQAAITTGDDVALIAEAQRLGREIQTAFNSEPQEARHRPTSAGSAADFDSVYEAQPGSRAGSDLESGAAEPLVRQTPRGIYMRGSSSASPTAIPVGDREQTEQSTPPAPLQVPMPDPKSPVPQTPQPIDSDQSLVPSDQSSDVPVLLIPPAETAE